MTNPSTRSCGRRPKSAKARNRGTYAGRCRGRYGDFAAGSGLLRLDCKGCRDRLAAKRGRIRRCERAIWAWRDGIGGGSAGESEVVMRAWSQRCHQQTSSRLSQTPYSMPKHNPRITFSLKLGDGAVVCHAALKRDHDVKDNPVVLRPALWSVLNMFVSNVSL